MWKVVHFIEENTVEAVPSSWILFGDEKCWWPHFTGFKLKSAISKRQAPSKDWNVYEIRVIGNTEYDDLAKARLQATRAETTSDLNSEVEKTRVRKKKNYPDFVGDSNEDYSDCERKRVRKKRKYSNVVDDDDEASVDEGSEDEIINRNNAMPMPVLSSQKTYLSKFHEVDPDNSRPITGASSRNDVMMSNNRNAPMSINANPNVTIASSPNLSNASTLTYIASTPSTSFAKEKNSDDNAGSIYDEIFKK